MHPAVKFADGTDDTIEGLAIPFGGPAEGGKDFDGEDFGPDTDFALDWFPDGRPLIYHHGKDGDLETTVQGRQNEAETRAEGIWARAQLDKSARYHATVAKLVRAGKLFFSSGSMPHLVRAQKDGHITRWPWVELSLTPTPSNLWAAAHYTKASEVVDRLTALDIAVPPGLIAEALKALDAPEDGWPDPAALEAKAGRVSAAVADLRDHARSSHEMRAKAGRALSAANRARIEAALASREAVAAAYADLEALLAETDPEAKAADEFFLTEALATLARAGMVGYHD